MFRLFALIGMIVTLILAVISAIRIRKSDKAEETGGLIGFFEKYWLPVLLVFFAAFLFTRIFKIESFPTGIHVDELSMAVDAKSLRDHGTDRYGVHLPPYLQNFGGGQNALASYVEALLLCILPPSIFAFRIQAVLWGALCFFALFGICYELTASRAFSLIAPFMVLTLPVCFMSERWGLESYMLLPFCTYTMYFIVRALKYNKDRDWFLAGLIMGVSLYTYAIAYVVWPVFLVLAGAYLLYVRKLSLRHVLLAGIPLVILAIPLILFQLVNFGLIPEFSIGFSDYRQLPILRGEEVSLSFIPYNAARYLTRLFFKGDELPYNSFDEFGTVYWFLVPFIFAGLVICIKDTVTSIRKREFSASALFVIFWIAATFCMLIITAPNINKVNELFLPFIVFIVIAIHRLFRKDVLFCVWLLALTGVSFVVFMYFYFFMQNTVYERNEMFTSPSVYEAISKSEKYYLKDDKTHIYALLEYGTIEPEMQVYFFAGDKGEYFDKDKVTYGRVTAEFPEEFDINENAVYIVGNEWPHISSYLISVGFMQDQTVPGYSILYR